MNLQQGKIVESIQKNAAPVVMENLLSIEEYDHLLSVLYSCSGFHEGFSPFLSVCCQRFNISSCAMIAVDTVPCLSIQVMNVFGMHATALEQLISKKLRLQYQTNQPLHALNKQIGSVNLNNTALPPDHSSMTLTGGETLGFTEGLIFSFPIQANKKGLFFIAASDQHGAIPQRYYTLLSKLTVHIEKAVKIHEKNKQYWRNKAHIHSFIPHIPSATMAVDPDTKIVSINTAMHTINEKYQLFKPANTHIIFNDQALNTQFITLCLLHQNKNTPYKNSENSISIELDSNRLTLTLSPWFESEDVHMGYIITANEHDSFEYPTAEKIKSMLDVTKSEANVIYRLLHGDDVNCVAKSLFFSEHTVRSYIKSALAKNGFKKQLEMVTFVLTQTP